MLDRATHTAVTDRDAGTISAAAHACIQLDYAVIIRSPSIAFNPPNPNPNPPYPFPSSLYARIRLARTGARRRPHAHIFTISLRCQLLDAGGSGASVANDERMAKTGGLRLWPKNGTCPQPSSSGSDSSTAMTMTPLGSLRGGAGLSWQGPGRCPPVKSAGWDRPRRWGALGCRHARPRARVCQRVWACVRVCW